MNSLATKSRSLVTAAVSALLMTACSSVVKSPSPAVFGTGGGPGQPKAVLPTAPPIEVLKGMTAHALTSLGDNRAPRFSPDSAKLLFLASSRPSHRQTQVYELDLLRMTERRVTFHDGDDEGANWDGPAKIVYSSITDEIKEDISLDHIKSVYESTKSIVANPNGMRPTPKITNGGEIYRQRLDGREIERLTEKTGPDVSPTASGSRIVFVSSPGGDPRLYLLSGSSSSLRAVTHGPDAAPAFSFDGKSLAWERMLPGELRTSQIFMTSDLHSALPLTSPGFVDKQPAWSAKGDTVVFASNRGGGKTFDLYMIDRKASCLKRLTDVQVDLSWPTLSPDGSKIAFSVKTNGLSQLYLMDDKSATLPCMNAPAPAAVAAKP